MSTYDKSQFQFPPHLRTLSVWMLLVAGGVAARFAFQDIPNFAPVAALALFAGFYFRSLKLAALVPLSVMVITDLFIGGYPRSWGGGATMFTVYSMLVLPVLFRGPLRHLLPAQRTTVPKMLARVSLVCGCCLASSLLFFAGTNLGVWLWFDLYERSWAGLATCYWQAVPFFRYTLAGDAFFALLLFGGYALLMQLGIDRQRGELVPVPVRR